MSLDCKDDEPTENEEGCSWAGRRCLSLPLSPTLFHVSPVKDDKSQGSHA